MSYYRHRRHHRDDDYGYYFDWDFFPGDYYGRRHRRYYGD